MRRGADHRLNAPAVRSDDDHRRKGRIHHYAVHNPHAHTWHIHRQEGSESSVVLRGSGSCRNVPAVRERREPFHLGGRPARTWKRSGVCSPHSRYRPLLAPHRRRDTFLHSVRGVRRGKYDRSLHFRAALLGAARQRSDSGALRRRAFLRRWIYLADRRSEGR